MTLHTPIFMQPAGADPDITYSGAELRNWINATLVLSAGAGVQGVATALDYQVTQRGAGANFSVDVAGGYVWVFGDDTAGQGTYFVWSDGTINVVTPSAPASGTRIHRLVLQIQDKLNNGVWTGYSAALTLLQDTGSGTPAEPNSALTLALISIAAGQASVLNANITDERPIIGSSAPWVDPAIASGWHNNSTIANDENIQVRLQGGTVDMRGTFSRSGSTWSNGAIAFTVPAGYYNLTNYKYVPINWAVSTGSTFGQPGMLRINGSGQAQVYISGAGGGVNGNVFQVSGSFFLT